MRCSVNRLLQLATKPRLQPMRLDTSSHVWPSASSKISRARRASSARSVRLLTRRVNSICSDFVNVIASLMNTIIVYKWLLHNTRVQAETQPEHRMGELERNRRFCSKISGWSECFVQPTRAGTGQQELAGLQ